MTTEIDPEEPAQESRWLRKLAMTLGIVFGLLALSYFIGTSSAFMKGVILPRVGQSLGADIAVQELSVSPFSQVILRKLTVKTTGTEPLITADEVRARYHLLAILRGNIQVHEVTLVSPNVRIVQESDGKSNLDPLLSKGGKAHRAPSKQNAQLDIRNINLKNGHVLLLKKNKSGAIQTTEIRNLDLSLDRLQNGQSGKATLGTILKFGQTSPVLANGSNDLLEARIDGSFDFLVDPRLLPKEIKGNTRFDLTRTEGAYADLRGLSGMLSADMTPTEMRQVALRFERGGQRLGQLLVSGPFDIDKAEARLKLEVQSVDRQVLNLFSAARGWDFGASTLNATNTVDLSRDWKLIVASGRLDGRQLSLSRNKQSTPALDLAIEYQTQVNLNEQTAVVQKLNILGKRNQKDLLTASLDKPMNITWAPRARGFTESTFQFAVKQLDLSDWGAMLGTNVLAGSVDLQVNVLAQKDAQQLTTKLTAAIRDLAAQFGPNRIDHAFVTCEAENFLEDFRMGDLRSVNFEIKQGAKPLIRGNGSANYDLSRKQATGQLTSETALPSLLQQVSIPGLNASSGFLRMSTAFTHKEDKDAATGSVGLNDFTGNYAEYQFKQFQGVLEYNLDLGRNVLQLYRATLSMRQGIDSGGTLDVIGKVNLTNKTAELTFKAVELNQNALRPFLAPSLGDKKLVSINLNGGGSARYDPNGESDLKGDLNLANWVVQDAKQNLPQAPLSVRLQFDGSLRKQILDLRQCVLGLSPTVRAKNQLELQARLDLNKTNAGPSQVNLAAESIDVTPYYDLFVGKTNGPKATSTPVSNQNQAEPEPVKLPFADLTAGFKIDRFFLREIAISNLLASARVQKGEITVKPLQMTLNGAPVNGAAALNLGVRGYTYDLSFQADRVPVEPLANSFSTTRPGFFKGNLIASAQVKGAGVTGASLRKHLSGQLAVGVTNMNLEIMGQKTRRMIEPVAAILNLPELLQTPLNWIDARAGVGQGQVNLSKLAVLSSAFYAESQGSIPIADVLTNSPLDLPVSLSLRRSLAQKAGLVPADAPTNTAYVSLPTFAKLAGTLGDPKTKTDKLVIAGLLARSASRFIPNAEGDAGRILQGVGNILAGQSAPAANTGAPTNAPAAPGQTPNATADLIQGIGGLLRSKPRTQPASTNAPATNSSPQSTSKADTNRSSVSNPAQTIPPTKK